MDVCFNLVSHQSPTHLNYKKEKMFRLNELILLENSKLSYKLQQKLLPTRLHTMLLSDSKKQSLVKRHKYQTRTKNIPKLPSAQTKQYHSSFLFQSIKDYENLSPEIRESKSLKTVIFKMNINYLVNEWTAPRHVFIELILPVSHLCPHFIA